ncbi:DUF397 domain-containing protein [Marinactinospora rubrisoli]|uniref:DUF397 domain-containing protein n=1 Tax=Marinactinospora rubrisoli TaxID=2715399 RepID=A0ABW2KKZ1_9ACTN
MSDWHTSNYSPNGSSCVEVRERAEGADVRDSQHREAGHLTFAGMEWAAFLRDVKADRL